MKKYHSAQFWHREYSGHIQDRNYSVINIFFGLDGLKLLPIEWLAQAKIAQSLFLQAFHPFSLQLHAARHNGPCPWFLRHPSFLVECLCRNDQICGQDVLQGLLMTIFLACDFLSFKNLLSLHCHILVFLNTSLNSKSRN